MSRIGKVCRCNSGNLSLQNAASFGSSFLFGQPLCSHSCGAAPIHSGSLCRIPQNEELAPHEIISLAEQSTLPELSRTIHGH